MTIDAAPRHDVSKSFTVALSTASNASIASGQGLAAGTIDNPNPIPALSTSGATVTASATTPTTATFTVSLSGPSNLTTTVNYTTANGSAVAGIDFTATSGALSFNPGETQKSITVPVDPEPAGASNKTFILTLSNPGSATIASGQATGTINATSTPTPTPTPTLAGAMFVTSGKGKKKVYHGVLDFTAPLAAASAGIASHYHVTQKISKKKTLTVPVLAAMYSPSNNSVTLVLHSPTPGKALQVMVSGLLGAGGTQVGGPSSATPPLSPGGAGEDL